MPPTYTKTIGRLGVDRYDFQDHVDGYSFRHNSQAVNLNPPLSVNNTEYYTLDSILAGFSSNINTLLNSGQGFITIGDGLDTYVNRIKNPSSPFDNSVPAINNTLNDLLTNTENAQNFRISDGGIIVIKSGTYIITDTIDIPPGITIMGEGFGTKLINQCPTPRPLFKIKADLSRIVDSGVDINEKFMFAKETKFCNLIIADNFIEPKFTGDTSYVLPQNIDSINPLVSVEEGANFTAENVKFLGKTTYSLGVVNQVTSFAIKVDSTVPNANGTVVSIKNCFIDGFSTAFDYAGTYPSVDKINITNNYIRAYGFLNSDFTDVANNAIIRMKATNVNLANNYCVGYDDTVTSLLYISSQDTTIASIVQAWPRINVASNNITVDRLNSLPTLSFLTLRLESSLALGSKYFTSLAYGNNNRNNNTFSLSVNSPASSPVLEAQASILFVNDILVASSSIYPGSRIIFGSDITSPSINQDEEFPSTQNAQNLRLEAQGADNGFDAGNLFLYGGNQAGGGGAPGKIIMGSGVVYNVVEISSDYQCDGDAYSDYMIVVDGTVQDIDIDLPPFQIGRVIIVRVKADADYLLRVRTFNASGTINDGTFFITLSTASETVRLLCSSLSNWYTI